MRAIIICFNFVLALFHSAYSITPEVTPASNFEAIQHQSFLFSQDSSGENLYFNIVLVDENNEEVSCSIKNKFSTKKNTFTHTSLLAYIFSGNSFKKNCSARFFNFSQPSLISFRVLRL